MELQQDALDEAFRRHKNYFQHFLENEDGFGGYAEKIRTMMSQKSSRLIVDINDLREYDSSFSDPNISSRENIATRILRFPAEYIPPFEEAVKELVFNYDSLYGSKEQMEATDITFHIGFEGDFGHHNVSPRSLLASYLTQLVCVYGIVTKCSAVRPKVVKSVHYCKETKAIHSREYRDNTALVGEPTTSVYPTKDENGNPLETEFGLCKYKDYQIISIQETPETAPLGQLPRSCDVIVENDLVDKCKPGDRIRIIGVYRPVGGKSTAQATAVFRTVLIANNLQSMGKEIDGIVMETDDLLNVREFAKRPDAFEILARSIAPSIYGHKEIKKALLLQLLGGVEKNLDNGTHLRGDINILMVGDPSTAKSQLLRFIRTIAPLAVSTSGRGSSGVGLTAAVTQDPDTKERRLEAGAMVLADRGIVCIDEFDKMSEVDRVAIHEVMEQQTVTIAKAGIHATLNARCSVLAAANPVYGQYNKNRKPQENIGLPDSLLSRFDLLFVVLDTLDRTADRNISDHVLRMHRYVIPGQEGVPLSLNGNSTDYLTISKGGSSSSAQDSASSSNSIFQKYDPLLHGGRPASAIRSSSNSSSSNSVLVDDMGILKLDFVKKFVYYAKTRFQPVLTDSAIDLIAEGYAELRSQQNNRTLPVTARSLETLIRLAAAHAKTRLSTTITVKDAEVAMSLMSFALYHEANIDSHGETNTSIPAPEVSIQPISQPVVEEMDIESPPVVSKKRSRSAWSEDTLRDAVMQIVMQLEGNSHDQEDEEAIAGIPLSTLLKELNKNASKKDQVSRIKVEEILLALENENKLMYIQAGEADEPMVVLV